MNKIDENINGSLLSDFTEESEGKREREKGKESEKRERKGKKDGVRHKKMKSIFRKQTFLYNFLPLVEEFFYMNVNVDDYLCFFHFHLFAWQIVLSPLVLFSFLSLPFNLFSFLSLPLFFSPFFLSPCSFLLSVSPLVLFSFLSLSICYGKHKVIK